MTPTDADLLHELAASLRDLSAAAALFEQNPSEVHRRMLNAANDDAEALLEDFVLRYGDIRPTSL